MRNQPWPRSAPDPRGALRCSGDSEIESMHPSLLHCYHAQSRLDVAGAGHATASAAVETYFHTRADAVYPQTKFASNVLIESRFSRIRLNSTALQEHVYRQSTYRRVVAGFGLIRPRSLTLTT